MKLLLSFTLVSLRFVFLKAVKSSMKKSSDKECHSVVLIQ